MRVVKAEKDLVIIELNNGVLVGIHGHPEVASREGSQYVEFQFVNATNLRASNMAKAEGIDFGYMLNVNYTPQAGKTLSDSGND